MSHRAAICIRCHAAFDEPCAREPFPAEMDPQRCACMALQSFRHEIEPGLYVRRRIER
jgi:hypothetical protein